MSRKLKGVASTKLLFKSLARFSMLRSQMCYDINSRFSSLSVSRGVLNRPGLAKGSPETARREAKHACAGGDRLRSQAVQRMKG